MRLIPQDTMSQYSTNFLLLPIPEYPVLDCAPNKIIKLVVLGGSSVGKTALVVRFLTKRFIGDYEANTGESALYRGAAESLKGSNLLCFATAAYYREAKQCEMSTRYRCTSNDDLGTEMGVRDAFDLGLMKYGLEASSYASLLLTRRNLEGALYSRKFTIDGEQISLQVQDTPFVSLEDDTDSICCQEQINRSIYWADGFVFVYSITDYESYRVIRPLHQHIRKIHPNANIPLLLMANKGDLLRARQVSSKEGLQLASELGGTYYEVSARENCEGVHEAFQQLCQEVSRMIGSCNGEKRRGLHLVRPKSPNMQDLKRRLKQALTSKGKSATTL